MFLSAITINKFSSSITSELFAILHALSLAYSLKIIKVVVVTDRLNSLQSITNWNWKKLSFANTIALYSTLSASGYEVRFLWVSGHQHIPGNEIADQLAKLSTAKLSSNPPKCVHCRRVNTRLNFTDMLPYLYQHSFVGNSIPDRHKRKCIQSYLSCPGAVLSVDPLPLCYNLSFVHRPLSPKSSYVTYWSSC